MNPLLETNERHSRMLFLTSLVIGLLLSPVVLRFVEHSMDSLNSASEHTTTQADRNSSQWDLRAMWY
jgi:hypothetical protein